MVNSIKLLYFFITFVYIFYILLSFLTKNVIILSSVFIANRTIVLYPENRCIMKQSLPTSNQAGIDFYFTMSNELEENVMFLSDDFPLSLYTQIFHCATSDFIPYHWHKSLQITWVYQGELEFSINGEKISLTADKLIFIKNNQLHTCKTVNTDTRSLCINFSPELFYPVIVKNYIIPFLKNPSFSYMTLPLEPHQITRLKGFFNWKNKPLEYFSALNFLAQIFEEVLSEFKEPKEPLDYHEINQFQLALDYIHSHYAEPLNIKDISNHTLINKTQLTTLFNKYTGMPPIKYLNEHRLNLAKNMIIQTDKQISEISADVGYNQISYFIKQFHSKYGYTPLKYRSKFKQAPDP